MKLLRKIEENSKLFPDRIAFRSRYGEISYKKLIENSKVLAHWISEQEKMGTVSNNPIVVYGHMQPEMLICFLACVYAGKSYIPIDESVPTSRVQQIIQKSESKLMFGSEKLEIDSTIQFVPFLQIENIFSSIENNINKSVSNNDVFYTIFTSGSTGMPKGVQITANCLDSFVDWMSNDFNLTNEEVFLNQAPFSFDLSVMDLYPALALGGTIYAVDKDLLSSMKDLFNYLIKGQLTVWTSTPSFMEICLMNPDFNQVQLPKLKTFLFCGETLPHGTASQLRNRFPNAKIFNTYGPTEATVAITSIEVTDDVLEKYPVLPIGKVKSDSRIVLLDENGKEAETGEITIVGPSVAKGYLNDPDKTSTVFFQYSNETAYRTGDIGSFNDKMLFYHGRKDFQIKLHGYRIELEEIEANMRIEPLIENAVVIPKIVNGACTELIAVTVIKENNFEKEFQLTSYLKKNLAERMPAYMIPRRFVYRTQLPMTNNGKVDRKNIAETVLS